MESMQTIREYLVEKLKEREGVEVTGEGHGWNNGPYEDLSIKLPDGQALYICIEESEEDGFVALCDVCGGECIGEQDALHERHYECDGGDP